MVDIVRGFRKERLEINDSYKYKTNAKEAKFGEIVRKRRIFGGDL